MSKRIAILGSTGSIGCNSLEVIDHLGPPYRVSALAGHANTARLLEQVKRYRPSSVAITKEGADDANIDQIAALGVRIYRGPAALTDLVERDDVDVVLAAVVGAAGLPATIATVRARKPLLLANKESLVVAGSLLIPEARRLNVPILPVDSEHSAIFQAMQCGRRKEVRRAILTASGGPFRTASYEQIERATLADALAHPTWRMGNKITIDSATMFNKGLELIEACWLFDMSADMIEVVIHPESIIHSMVEFVDGAVLAQLSPPDMRTPIQYALTYPDRLSGISRRMDFSKACTLRLEPPDLARFPALTIAYDVARRGGTLGAVMNAANEVAVAAFVDGRINFGQICRVVALTIATHQPTLTPTLDQLLEADRSARQSAEALILAGPVTSDAAGAEETIQRVTVR